MNQDIRLLTKVKSGPCAARPNRQTILQPDHGRTILVLAVINHDDSSGAFV
jgi:hypothetical protein